MMPKAGGEIATVQTAMPAAPSYTGNTQPRNGGRRPKSGAK
jgi:hypothetical protein